MRGVTYCDAVKIMSGDAHQSLTSPLSSSPLRSSPPPPPPPTVFLATFECFSSSFSAALLFLFCLKGAVAR